MTLGIIGWAVVQSLWQWTLVAGLAALILGCLRDARAQTRYAVGCAALLTMALMTLVTLNATPSLAEPVRMRTLYAWRGLAMLPGIDAAGTSIVRAIAVIWLGGVVVGSIRLFNDWRHVRRLCLPATSAVDDTSQSAAAALHERLRLRQRVPVRRSRLASVPMVVGVRQPRILLPAHAAALLTTDQLRGVLAHELGHVRRGDVALNAVQAVADVLMFHHPAARWLSRRIRTEREYACDDVAVAVIADAHAYARALALLEEARSDCRLVVAAAAGTLLDRVQRVLKQPRGGLTPVRGAIAMAGASILAIALFALAMNVPPPWVPAGARLRRPGPAPGGVMSPRPGASLPQKRSVGP